jgi:N-sulfoglucosamine sulfohydrolase
MRMRHLFLTCLAFWLGGAAVAAGEKKRPNILVILSDDTAAAHFGCYGFPGARTPNIDRVAAKALRFDRFYVTTPQCVPSRASLMTGRSPIDIQMTRFSAPLAAQYRVYPEIMRQAGYFAGVAGRTYHLDGAGVNPVSLKVLDKYDLKTFPRRLDYVKTTGARPEMLGQFREFLDAVPKGKPFVLQLCFSDTHRPFDAKAFEPPTDPKTIKLPAHFPDTQLVREDFARYLDELSRFDADVATVLEELRRRGLEEDTLVIISADNGAALLRGKGTLYDYGLHVPFIVHWPGHTPAGSNSAALLSGEDLAPTLLEAAGLPLPKEMTGKSFVSLLRKTDGQEVPPPRRYVFCQRGAHGSGLPGNSANFDLGRCVISERYKLIYNALGQLPYHPVDFAGDALWTELKELHASGKLEPLFARLYFTPERPMFELYDLKDDPDELKNRYGDKELAEVQREHLAALHEWMILQRDFVPLPIPPNKKAAKKKKKGAE